MSTFVFLLRAAFFAYCNSPCIIVLDSMWYSHIVCVVHLLYLFTCMPRQFAHMKDFPAVGQRRARDNDNSTITLYSKEISHLQGEAQSFDWCLCTQIFAGMIIYVYQHYTRDYLPRCGGLNAIARRQENIESRSESRLIMKERANFFYNIRSIHSSWCLSYGTD